MQRRTNEHPPHQGCSLFCSCFFDYTFREVVGVWTCKCALRGNQSGKQKTDDGTSSFDVHEYSPWDIISKHYQKIGRLQREGKRGGIYRRGKGKWFDGCCGGGAPRWD